MCRPREVLEMYPIILEFECSGPTPSQVLQTVKFHNPLRLLHLAYVIRDCFCGLNETDDDGAFPTMTLVNGGFRVIATPLPALPRTLVKITETIQKCVEIVYSAETVSLIVILVEQVDSSIFYDRGEMITPDVVLMIMEDAVVKLFLTLLGIHPMSPVQGC